MGFSLVLEVSGALNLYVVVWNLFYRLQESLHRSETCGGWENCVCLKGCKQRILAKDRTSQYFICITHLSAVCWPALSLTSAAYTDPDTQEVEHLVLPFLYMCVAKALQSHMDVQSGCAHTHTHARLLEATGRPYTIIRTRLHLFPW